MIQREVRAESNLEGSKKYKLSQIEEEITTRLPLTSGFKLLTSRTEFPGPERPGMAIRPAAAAAAAADGIAKGASAPCTFGTERPRKIKEY